MSKTKTKLTPEQKAENARQRIIDRLKCLRIGTAKGVVAREFQKMIRWEYAASHGGILHCCTCDSAEPIEGHGGQGRFDSGHFIGGRRASLIFDERNCHPQCKQCNKFFSGRPDRYEAFMVATYGARVVEELRELGRQDRKFTFAELADLLIGFRKRIKTAKEKLRNL